jgi:outer membrane protein assembly factor BamD (BamD/ComL family)
VKRSPRAIATMLLLAGSACVPLRQKSSEVVAPTAASEWPTVYARAVTDANESRTSAADRALAEFAQRFPGSAEASEVPYWRALLKLDPSNASAIRESMAMLETYLANAPAGTHRLEAATIRRLGLALEQRNATIAAMPTVAVVRPEDKARDEELLRLRDELNAANAELARIRRRLTRPRP